MNVPMETRETFEETIQRLKSEIFELLDVIEEKDDKALPTAKLRKSLQIKRLELEALISDHP